MDNRRVFWLAFLCVLLAGCIDNGSSGSGSSAGPGHDGAVTSVQLSVVLSATAPSSSPFATADQVSTVAVDVRQSGSLLVQGQLLSNSAGIWSGTIAGLPVGPLLTFLGQAYDSASIKIFSGSSNQTLTGNGDVVSLALQPIAAPAPELPRINGIVRPANALPGSTSDITVYVSGSPEQTLSFEFTGPAGSFEPAQGSIATETDGTAAITTKYTAPSTLGSYTLTITVSNSSGISIEQTFTITVGNSTTGAGAPGISISFSPVVVGLKGQRIGSSIEWTVTASDDGPLNELAYQWGFTGGLTFSNPQSNPAELMGYDETDAGTLSVSVTDHNGAGSTTTLFYTLPAGLFPNNVVREPIWISKSAMPSPRFAAAAAAVGGKFYLLGGDTGSAKLNAVVEYDPVVDGWTDCGSGCSSMPTARSAMCAAAVNGKIYVIGGLTESGDASGVVDEFDPATNQWTQCGGTCQAMPTARFAHALGVVDGRIHVLGGHDGTNRLQTLEIYDPALNQWTSGAAMPTAREQLTVSAVNGKLYAIGGRQQSVLNDVEEYDPAQDGWSNCGSSCAPLPTARTYSASAAVQGKIYVIGGAGPSAKVEAFDPVSNTWAAKTDMPTPREQLALAVEETLGHVYAIGGWNGSAPSAAVELYDPGADP